MRAVALVVLLTPMPLASQGVTPPGGGAPIYRHPPKDLLSLFDSLCVTAPEDIAEQERTARDLGFAPVPQPRGLVDMHKRSISFSVLETTRGRQCTVSGLTDRTTSPEEIGKLSSALKPRISRVFALSATKEDGANTTGVVLKLLTPKRLTESTE